MNPQLAELLQQRAKLRADIAQQRRQLADTCHHWQKPLMFVEQGLKGVHWLRARPVVTTVTIALVAVFWLRRGGLVGVIVGVWKGWKWYRQARTLLIKVGTVQKCDNTRH